MTRLMKLQPVLIALSLINLALLVILLAQCAPSRRQRRLPTSYAAGARIIDSAGKVRASISVLPAEKLKDGSTYPETVLLRLITSEGRPVVKIRFVVRGWWRHGALNRERPRLRPALSARHDVETRHRRQNGGSSESNCA